MWKFLVDLARSLNPSVADTPEQVFAWRQTVAFVLILMSLLTMFNTSRGYGWTEWAGVPGFVNINQLGNIEQLARETREEQLVQSILDLTRRYCQSYEVNDQSGMNFAFQSLQVSRAKYRKLMNVDYPQLMCSVSSQPAKSAP